MVELQSFSSLAKENTNTEQNNATTAGLCEAKTQSQSQVHKPDWDFQSSVLPDLCNPYGIAKLLVL